MWLYVGRNIVSKLSDLRAGMAAIASGRRDIAVNHQGTDEIAAMGRSVEVVRQIAIERDALLAERAEAAQRLERQVAERTAELRDALGRQTATAELLQLMISSPGELAPVLDALLERALKLCDAAFGTVWTYNDGLFDAVAMPNRPAVLGELVRRGYSTRPDSDLGRLIAGERLVHITDASKEPFYRAGSPGGGASRPRRCSDLYRRAVA
jgi:hypothetical protein